MSSIVKTFIGKHIDLSKIVAISEAKFEDEMGFGGWFVSFEINIQLLDKPIIYKRRFELDESNYDFSKRKYEMIYGADGKTPLAVERLQAQINELIEQWRQSKVDQ